MCKEKLLSCPSCGSMNLFDPRITPIKIYSHRVMCNNCGFNGSYHESSDEAVNEWNAKYRTPYCWTKEPPKVAGYYWHRLTSHETGVIKYFSEERHPIGEYAGPIPVPTEPCQRIGN